jgi:protease IV
MSNIPQPEGNFSQQPPSAPPSAPTGGHYYPPPPPPRKTFFLKFLFSLIVLIAIGGLLASFLVGGGGPQVQEQFFSNNKNATDKIVILPVEGIILESADGFIKQAIDAALEDEHVKAIVLRVDSPGGTVSGSDYIYHHLCELLKKKKIPLVVSMGSIAASGGYYVSMAVGHEADTIFIEPTGLTGSIGVIIPHYNVAEFMKTYGLADDSISSRPLKQMLSPTKTMTTEEKNKIQALVNDSFEQFKTVVRSGRSDFDKNPEKLEALATGEIFTANQAKAKKLVDEIGYVEDAVAKAIALAHLDSKKVKVVRYKQEVSLRKLLLGQESSKSQTLDLKALLEMTTPKAYYLASWLPVLAGTAK